MLPAVVVLFVCFGRQRTLELPGPPASGAEGAPVFEGSSFEDAAFLLSLPVVMLFLGCLPDGFGAGAGLGG